MPLKIGQPVQLGLEPVTIPNPETDQPWGGPYNPAHANYGEQAQPYPYEIYESDYGPYGPSADFLGFDAFSVAAGQLKESPTGDLQPLTHAAPWPKGVPQSVTPDAAVTASEIERAEIHASDMGLSRASHYKAAAQNDQWTAYDFEDAGESNLEPIPGQLKGAAAGYGTHDRAQSFARQNEYGFDTAHRARRWATGSIPGNYDMLRPGSRPMIIRPHQSFIPNGTDSPFEGQDIGAAFDTQGSVLTTLPQEYQAPPEPAVSSSPLPDNTVPVEWW